MPWSNPRIYLVNHQSAQHVSLASDNVVFDFKMSSPYSSLSSSFYREQSPDDWALQHRLLGVPICHDELSLAGSNEIPPARMTATCLARCVYARILRCSAAAAAASVMHLPSATRQYDDGDTEEEEWWWCRLSEPVRSGCVGLAAH